MKVVSVPFDYASPLVNSYIKNFNQVSGLFEHNSYDQGAFRDRFEVVMRDYQTDRMNLARILKQYNLKLNCGQRTIENIDKLKAPETTVIVTGQQAGVFTGPLYTIYKAVTAVQLAGEISAKSGKPVIPMFWVAAEDHDYAEIDHVDLVNKDQELVRLRMNYSPEGKYSVGHIPVTEAVFSLIDELEAATNPSEWKNDIIAVLRNLASQNENIADWFAAVMAWLFKDAGLVMVNPMLRELRRLWAGTFNDFLNKAEMVNEKLSEGMKKVSELGFKPQVEKEENNINMFVYVDGERLALFKNGDVFYVRGRTKTWSLDELREIALNSPEQLSPNVVLRPVAQDALLPILAYIAGPGEISYYALYREIYPLFGQRMPVIYPRVNITVVERGISNHMDNYGISFSDGAEAIAKKLEDYLEAQDHVGIDRLFEKYTEELKNSFENLADSVTGISPDLKAQGNETLNKIIHQVEHFEQKTRQYHRKACDLAVKRFKNVETQLFPRRNLQERVFNVFPYLFKYPGFINELLQVPLIEDNNHKLLYIGGTNG